MFNAITKDNFIAKEDCEYLINFANKLDAWENGGTGFWEGRVLNYYTVLKHDKKAADILIDANIRCGNIIRNNYHVSEIYSDTLQIVRWFPGMEQPPHADDMTNTDILGFEHRAFGSIIYLNDDYQGGNTYYPNYDIRITPKSGTLAIHPGDPEHLHGVTKIEDGMRYTIASFWTPFKNKGHEWHKE
jgi:2OG-Fe(II) oxygenase superfamily